MTVNEYYYSREYRKTRLAELNENAKRYQKTADGVFSTSYNHHIKNSVQRGHPKPAYTLEDLKLAFNGERFMELYRAWVDSGYQKGMKPSFDRKDADKPYELDNLQLMTYAENRSKGHKEGSEKSKFPAEQYDLDMNLIATHECVASAAESSGVSRSRISECARGKIKSTKGFIFRYPNGVNKVTPSRHNKDKLRSLIESSLSEYGYYCNRIAYNSGFVMKSDRDSRFPSVDGFSSAVGIPGFALLNRNLCADMGLGVKLLVVHRMRVKVYYTDAQRAQTALRAIPELEIALNEWINEREISPALSD